MCLCVWRGVVSTKLTGLGGTVSADFDSNGMHINFYEGHSNDKSYFSCHQRSANPVSASPQVSVPLIS